MAVKKSIFEKFKLVEKIEEESEIKNEDHESLEAEDNNKEYEINKNTQEKLDKTNGTVIENLNNEKNNKDEEHKDNKVNMDRVSSLEEIYNKFSMENDNTKKIYIIDSFFNALPGNIPTEIKKQSVINIIAASGMNLDNLIKDGKQRVNVLSGFLKDFSKNTEEKVNLYQAKIEELMKEIEDLKQKINKKENLKNEQKSLIDYEVQKIINIMESVK